MRNSGVLPLIYLMRQNFRKYRPRGPDLQFLSCSLFPLTMNFQTDSGISSQTQNDRWTSLWKGIWIGYSSDCSSLYKLLNGERNCICAGKWVEESPTIELWYRDSFQRVALVCLRWIYPPVKFTFVHKTTVTDPGSWFHLRTSVVRCTVPRSYYILVWWLKTLSDWVYSDFPRAFFRTVGQSTWALGFAKGGGSKVDLPDSWVFGTAMCNKSHLV